MQPRSAVLSLALQMTESTSNKHKNVAVLVLFESSGG